MKTHMIRFPLWFAIAALSCAESLRAQEVQEERPPLYASMSVGVNVPTWNNVKPGFALGAALGQIITERSYAGAEVLYLRNAMDSETYMGITAHGTLEQIPVLVTYRYDVPRSDISLGNNPAWCLQVGGSVGAVMQKLTVFAYGVSVSESQWAFALGGQAMAVYKINEATWSNVGLKAIWTARTEFNEAAGTNIILTAGLNIRF